MSDLDVIEDPRAAVVALDPIRARLLAELRQPASAATLAGRVGLTRQKVNYHLRAIERHGLVTVAEERRHGGLTERLLVATAASYVVSPGALGPLGGDPARSREKLGARWLIACAARVVREVGAAVRRDEQTPTFALDAEVRLASPAARAAFAADLADAVTAVVQRHHVDDGRPHRLLVAAHEIPREPKEQEA
ncbi:MULTISPECIES: ArsR/SmtB family transcription factor [unclassified Conexibacter]|uniref:ArsR/SmtB family transcription factor n=1 Tax=unclassified Conexibacter TaxID=2627773 RepID=UPI00351C39AC